MAQIKVMKAESAEKKIEDDSQDELKEHPGGSAEAEDQGEKDIPLEKMTKAQLLTKVKDVQATVEKNFDLYRLLDDVEDMFSLKAESKRLHLVFERADDVSQYIRTDEVKLRQVLINLLNNAIKFTEEGGVTVRVNSQQSTVNSQQRERIGGETETAHCPLPTCRSWSRILALALLRRK